MKLESYSIPIVEKQCYQHNLRIHYQHWLIPMRFKSSFRGSPRYSNAHLSVKALHSSFTEGKKESFPILTYSFSVLAATNTLSYGLQLRCAGVGVFRAFQVLQASRWIQKFTIDHGEAWKIGNVACGSDVQKISHCNPVGRRNSLSSDAPLCCQNLLLRFHLFYSCNLTETCISCLDGSGVLKLQKDIL